MQSNNWAIITGASSGIGAAIFRRLAIKEPNLNCLGVGRSLDRLQEVKQSIPSTSNVRTVTANLTRPEGITAVTSALPANACVKYIIHAAAIFPPVGPLIEMDSTKFREAIAINLEAPLFLTKALLPNLKQYATEETKPRVLHVSSGAACNAYEGWGSYCITKAGFNMMYRILAAELSHDNILVGSVRPGVVDTPMQDFVRSYNGPKDYFPTHHEFVDLHARGKLERPDVVAIYLHWLLKEVEDEEYTRDEWDIRSSKDDTRWKEYQALNS